MKLSVSFLMVQQDKTQDFEVGLVSNPCCTGLELRVVVKADIHSKGAGLTQQTAPILLGLQNVEHLIGGDFTQIGGSRLIHNFRKGSQGLIVAFLRLE